MLGSTDIYTGQVLNIRHRKKRSNSMPGTMRMIKNYFTPEKAQREEAPQEEEEEVGIPVVAIRPRARAHSIHEISAAVPTTDQYQQKERPLEETLPLCGLPKLLGGTHLGILTDDHYQTTLVPSIESSLARHYRGYDWKLVYSLAQHGASLSTLYHKVNGKFPTLLVVKSHLGQVFGAFVSDAWQTSPMSRFSSYYGTGESWLFTTYPDFHVFPWSGKNSMFMFSNDESLALGGGGGFGLFLNSDLSRGSSAPCGTFENPYVLGLIEATFVFVLK